MISAVFFNESYATVIQFISLPLEIIGFSFAFIELKYPELADKIEERIDIVEYNSLGKIVEVKKHRFYIFGSINPPSVLSITLRQCIRD